MNHMNGDQILAVYEEASAITRQMLLAAREGDWDRLVAHEKDCAARFVHLMTSEPGQTTDAAFQRRKAEIIHGILDDDAQIRMLVEPWLMKLSVLIDSTRQQSRLSQAYGDIA